MFTNKAGNGIVDKIRSIEGYEKIFVDNKLVDKEAQVDTANELIDVMYNFSDSQWNKIMDIFSDPKYGFDFSEAVEKLDNYTNFFGISLTQNPGWRFTVDGHFNWALLIPILAGVTQFISVKLTENRSKVNTNNEDNPMASSMKVMNMVMPILSAVFCVSFPSCMGIYWIAGSVVQIVQQIFINRYMDKIDVEAMVQKNIEKANAKRAKKGLPPQKMINGATVYAEEVKKVEAREARQEERKEAIKDSTEYYSKVNDKKPGSLAAKANMVKLYNEKNNKN